MVAVRAGPGRRAFHRAGRPSKAPVGSMATSTVIAAAISVVPSSYPSWSTSRSVQPDEPLSKATQIMAEKDIGSLVVMEHGDLVGMLTFREVILCIVKNGGEIGGTLTRTAMDDAPLTCTPETEIDEVRRMMLGRHARYMPVLNKKVLEGVISFYDVAKAVVDGQNFENKMLKAYIRDWPGDEDETPETKL